MNTAAKVRENRVRRVAARRGLRLERSRSRDDLDLTYGMYRLVAAAANPVTPPAQGWLTIGQAEGHLARTAARHRALNGRATA